MLQAKVVAKATKMAIEGATLSVDDLAQMPAPGAVYPSDAWPVMGSGVTLFYAVLKDSVKNAHIDEMEV